MDRCVVADVSATALMTESEKSPATSCLNCLSFEARWFSNIFRHFPGAGNSMYHIASTVLVNPISSWRNVAIIVFRSGSSFVPRPISLQEKEVQQALCWSITVYQSAIRASYYGFVSLPSRLCIFNIVNSSDSIGKLIVG